MDEDRRKANNDNRILAATLTIMDNAPKEVPVILVTNDALMQIRAYALKIKTQEYKNDSVSTGVLYTGRKSLTISQDHIDKLYREGRLSVSELNKYELEGSDVPEFLENEFLTLHAMENNASALAWIQHSTHYRHSELQHLPEFSLD